MYGRNPIPSQQPAALIWSFGPPAIWISCVSHTAEAMRRKQVSLRESGPKHGRFEEAIKVRPRQRWKIRSRGRHLALIRGHSLCAGQKIRASVEGSSHRNGRRGIQPRLIFLRRENLIRSMPDPCIARMPARILVSCGEKSVKRSEPHAS